MRKGEGVLDVSQKKPLIYTSVFYTSVKFTLFKFPLSGKASGRASALNSPEADSSAAVAVAL